MKELRDRFLVGIHATPALTLSVDVHATTPAELDAGSSHLVVPTLSAGMPQWVSRLTDRPKSTPPRPTHALLDAFGGHAATPLAPREETPPMQKEHADWK